jgi:hypothetical protein
MLVDVAVLVVAVVADADADAVVAAPEALGALKVITKTISNTNAPRRTPASVGKLGGRGPGMERVRALASARTRAGEAAGVDAALEAIGRVTVFQS